METKTRSKPTRILGIDYGLARLGIAISDERKIIATPLLVFRSEKKTEQTVLNLIDEIRKLESQGGYTIESIVIGLPLLMSGKKGFLADEVQHFSTLLSQFLPIPIIPWDERLSTVQAERSLREEGMTRKKRSSKVDTVAAVIILQNYLDSIS